MNSSDQRHNRDQLRAVAESQLAASRRAGPQARPVDDLVHELQVHQIELEILNETLSETKIALEQSRDRYVDLYEFAPVGYLTLTAQGLIGELNLTATRLLGRERGNLLRRSFGALVIEGDPAPIMALADRCRPPAEVQVELLLRRGDGTLFWAQVDAASSADGICLALTDISPRKRVEGELRAAVADAERANNAKSRFLAAASHDLRQPLAALRLYTNALQENVAPNAALLANMDDCVGSLSLLLNDLLDLSKLEAGVVKPNPADFAVFEFLASLEAAFRPAAQAKGLVLRVQPSRLIARCDPILLKRIVGNILDNAIQYTERGAVVVGCRYRAGRFWIELRDSGLGMASEQIPEAFEAFKQLGDGARTRGSGLGLAIAANAARLLGLEISVRSWPGRGSIFAVALPLGQPAGIPAPAGAGMPAGRTLRVALVEDNAMVREAMVYALRDAGHQVVATADGGGLLAELGNFSPDIVVSDYRLALGETGFAVIAAVRRVLGTELPAVIITGDTDPKLMASMAGHGVSVLHKPVDIARLQRSLAELTAPARWLATGEQAG